MIRGLYLRVQAPVFWAPRRGTNEGPAGSRGMGIFLFFLLTWQPPARYKRHDRTWVFVSLDLSGIHPFKGIRGAPGKPRGAAVLRVSFCARRVLFIPVWRARRQEASCGLGAQSDRDDLGIAAMSHAPGCFLRQVQSRGWRRREGGGQGDVVVTPLREGSQTRSIAFGVPNSPWNNKISFTRRASPVRSVAARRDVGVLSCRAVGGGCFGVCQGGLRWRVW
jgi:hypothetical protein